MTKTVIARATNDKGQVVELMEVSTATREIFIDGVKVDEDVRVFTSWHQFGLFCKASRIQEGNDE